ncbi:hypothetical protein KMP13_09680 [Epibacterium ulvae]|nr:hypothetical protein [Epibacterium ulvae]MBT8154160.1 hypothetical protein [Epibacterium ulvae]
MVEQLKRDFRIAILHILEGFGLVQRARVVARRPERPVDRQIRTRR